MTTATNGELDSSGTPGAPADTTARRRRIGCLAAGLASFVAAAALVALAAGMVYRHQRQEVDRVLCVSNLKQLGVATHNFHDIHRYFPPHRPAPESGEFPTSWRVDLLLYLEREELYDLYDRSQGWDGPANRPIAELMPDTYACPADPFALDANRTSYFAVEAAGAIRDPDAVVDFSRVYDGLSGTLLYVESSQHDVPWLSPEDLPASDLVAAEGEGAVDLRGRHSGSANVVYADASVGRISPTIDPHVLRALITRERGESYLPP